MSELKNRILSQFVHIESREGKDLPQSKPGPSFEVLELTVRVDDSPNGGRDHRKLSERERRDRQLQVYAERIVGIVKNITRALSRAGFWVKDGYGDVEARGSSVYLDVGRSRRRLARIRISDHQTANPSCCTISVLVRASVKGTYTLEDGHTGKPIQVKGIVQRVKKLALRKPLDTEPE